MKNLFFPFLSLRDKAQEDNCTAATDSSFLFSSFPKRRKLLNDHVVNGVIEFKVSKAAAALAYLKSTQIKTSSEFECNRGRNFFISEAGRFHLISQLNYAIKLRKTIKVEETEGE